jgi:topoisomerase-4 subunit A
MSLDKGEKPLVPAKVEKIGAGGTAPAGNTVAAISASGWLLLFPLAELKTMAKGRGTIIQEIPPKDELVAVAVGNEAFVVSGAGRGGKSAEWSLSAKEAPAYRGVRARKGHPIPAKLKPTGLSTG